MKPTALGNYSPRKGQEDTRLTYPKRRGRYEKGSYYIHR